jgi:hypothetical protein
MEKTEIAGIKIGGITLYRNTASKICQCKVESFKQTNSGYWLNGIDVKTNAKVWYSVGISKDLNDGANWQYEQNKSGIHKFIDWILENEFVSVGDGHFLKGGDLFNLEETVNLYEKSTA